MLLCGGGCDTSHMREKNEAACGKYPCKGNLPVDKMLCSVLQNTAVGML